MKKVRFFIIAAKDADNNVVKDFDMYTFLLSFGSKIEENVESVRKDIDGRAIRCLPPKNVSKDLKQLVISFGRRKKEDLYHENPDKIDMSKVNEKIYDMNTVFYSGTHKVAFITLDNNGPTYKAIAKYLSTFCEYNICIAPVIESLDLVAIRNAKKARGFGFEMILNESLMSLINQEYQNSKNKTVLQSLIPDVVRRKDELNCFSISVEFRMSASDRKSHLNLPTVMAIIEELDISQEFVKDLYIRCAKNENKPIETINIKKKNLYVEHTFNLTDGQKFDSDYLRNNGQNVIGAHVNDFYEFSNEYFD